MVGSWGSLLMEHQYCALWCIESSWLFSRADNWERGGPLGVPWFPALWSRMHLDKMILILVLPECCAIRAMAKSRLSLKHLPLTNVRSMSLGLNLDSTTYHLCSSSHHLWACPHLSFSSLYMEKVTDITMLVLGFKLSGLCERMCWSMEQSQLSQRWSSEVDFYMNAHSYLFNCLFRAGLE